MMNETEKKLAEKESRLDCECVCVCVTGIKVEQSSNVS